MGLGGILPIRTAVSDMGAHANQRGELFLGACGVERAGTSFAFPSQTLYLGRDGARDPQRADEVAREVADRRERGELAVPEPPIGLAEKLRKG